MMRSERLLALAILLPVIFFKYSILDYGLPYQFYPDETYLMKDSFKMLLNFSHGDFSQPTNLFFWAMGAWYALVFCFGLLTGSWHSLAEFQDLLIAEDSSMYFSGRLLSLIFCVIGTYYLIRLVMRMTGDRPLRILLALAFALSPIELISGLWIKFDAMCYCFTAIFIFNAWKYFAGGETKLRNRLILLGFIGVSLRIDMIAFLAAFFWFDFFPKWRANGFMPYVRETWWPAAKGVILYCCITLLPAVLIYKWSGAGAGGNAIAVVETYEEVIFTKVWENAKNGELFGLMGYNLFYYFVLMSAFILGPVLVAGAGYAMFRDKEMRFFRFAFILFMLPLLIFRSYYPHYFLPASTLLLLLAASSLRKIQKPSWRYAAAALHVVYMAGITFQIVYAINFSEDTRISSRRFLLKHTTAADTLAVENFHATAVSPPLEECVGVLKEKARITREHNLGTGITFDKKAERSDPALCRTILEVSHPQRYVGTPYEGKWATDFSPAQIERVAPPWYVSATNYFDPLREADSMTVYMRKYYKQEQSFIRHFADTRVSALIIHEDFFLPIYVYRRAD
ncbi:MAG: hypothetical protein FD123_1329 [Bacteroidetes bacterium]|nr:MAG: hypothetical protein FD123_1329 [Bacteroidota bacterium]